MTDEVTSFDPVELFEKLDERTEPNFWLYSSDFGTQYIGSEIDETLRQISQDTPQENSAAFVEDIHPNDQERLQNKMELLTDGHSIDVEFRTKPPTDKQRRFRAVAFPLSDEHDSTVAIGGMIRELTDQEQRQQRLSHYERAVESSTDLIVAVDIEERYLFVNEAYCTYHDVEEEDIIGRRLSDVLEEALYQRIKANVEVALDGETISYRMNRTHPTKGERIFDIKYYPLWHKDEVTGGVGVLRDVTDREERTRHLQVLDRVLRHNLRNDLTVIGGLASEITETDDENLTQIGGEISEKADGLLETSEKGRAITSIITEQPQLHEIDIVDTIERSRSAVSTEGTITVDAPDSAAVYAIPAISDALEELVTNAVIHNDQQEPVIRIKAKTTGKRVELIVEDNGPGLPELERAVLASGETPDPLQHGTGMGLWLIYWAVKRSHGEITVKERDSRGTRIIIEIPEINGAK